VNPTLKFKALVICGALLSAFWASEARSASGSFQQSLSVDEPILLDVATGSGTIDIRAGSSNRVEVTGNITVGIGLFKRKRDEAQELVRRFESAPPVNLVDGRLQVGHIKDRAYRHNVTISYEVVVPVGTQVKSHTGSGSQSISGIAGPVEAGTGSGTLTLADIGGIVEARTGSGAIRADGIAGAFEGHTGSGSIRLTQEAPGDVVVSTGSGSTELHGVVGALRVHSGSGRIEVDGQQEGPWKLDTGSGSVQIKLPENAAFELDAESSSGSIIIDHPIMVQGKISKRHLSGQVRGGGELLRIETGSGGIRIE
jgi:hypothetical protein